MTESAGIALAIPRQRRLAELAEFIPGPSTEIVLTACKQVAISPGLQFNPLYLHGAVGTGKSHLLEGICRQLRRSHPNLQVVLITAEGFANYFTQSLCRPDVTQFPSEIAALICCWWMTSTSSNRNASFRKNSCTPLPISSTIAARW